MAIKINFNGEEIVVPGAYSRFEIAQTGDAPLSSSGIVGIVGEAEAGEPQVLDIITKSQFDSAIKRYKSGPIADAIGLLKAPSKDGRILGGASRIVIYKTNNSTKAELDKTVAKFVSKNWGTEENTISVLVSEGAIADEQAIIVGSIDGPFSITLGDTLILKIAGATYTYTAPATVGAQSAADAAIALNNAPDWAPSLPIQATAIGDKVQIEVLASVAENDESYISVDAASTLDTIYGIIGDDRGKKGSRIVTAKKGVVTESSNDVGGESAIRIQYSGTGVKCELTVAKVSGKLNLSTDTGVPAENLNIDLEDSEGLPLLSFQQLVDLIDANPNYTASVLATGVALRNANELDYYAAINCLDVAVDLNRDMYLLTENMNAKSTLISIERKEVAGALGVLAAAEFLVGGTYGVSTNTDYLNGFNALKAVRINIAVPLISQDSGGVSIDSVNAVADNYAREGWTTLGKSERQVYVSKLGTKQEFKDAALTLQSEFCTILGQDIRALGANGTLKWFDPWAHACIYAGMQAGGDIGEPITAKVINVNDVRVRDNSWDARVDETEMIEAGCAVTRSLDTGGFEIAVGNTTYGLDSNFMRNRSSVMEAAGFVLFDLRFNLEKAFTGTKARTGGATEVLNFVKDRMEVYLEDDITVGNENNDQLGYRALEVLEDGNITTIKITITVVEGRDFILPDIVFERNRQSA